MALNNLDSAAHALATRFSRQRPLRGGSLLITILGDSIAPRGGAVTLGSLIKLAQPFGLSERLVRTSISRLAQDGWLDSRRAGRQSEYRITEHGRSRFTEATQRIYGEPPHSWNYRWTLLLLPAQASATHRERIREEMLWLGFGQIAPGVLAHPSRSAADTEEQLHGIDPKSLGIILEASSRGLEQDRRLICTGWNLAELGRRYKRFADSFAPTREALSTRTASASESAFVIRTLLIHEYRKIHLRDPLLPHDLLPNDWIGIKAYELCADLYRKVFVPAEAHLSMSACRLDGPLNAASREAHHRFKKRIAADPSI